MSSSMASPSPQKRKAGSSITREVNKMRRLMATTDLPEPRANLTGQDGCIDSRQTKRDSKSSSSSSSPLGSKGYLTLPPELRQQILTNILEDEICNIGLHKPSDPVEAHEWYELQWVLTRVLRRREGLESMLDEVHPLVGADLKGVVAREIRAMAGLIVEVEEEMGYWTNSRWYVEYAK